MSDAGQIEQELFPNGDWFLRTLVHMANGTPTEYAITLQVRGVVVSGYLVSGHRYFEAFGIEFAGMVKEPDAAGRIAGDLARFGEIYHEQPDDREAGEVLPVYIHLKDARFISQSGAPSLPANRGVWWRGRISEVDGFCLGGMRAERS